MKILRLPATTKKSVDRTMMIGGRHFSSSFYVKLVEAVFFFSLVAFLLTIGPGLVWVLQAPPASSSIETIVSMQPLSISKALMEAKTEVFVKSRFQMRPDALQGITDPIDSSPARFRGKGDDGLGFGRNGDEQSSLLGLSSDIKIYVYDLPPEYNVDWLSDTRCGSHLFAAEVAIHQNLLRSSVRTLDPEEADYFFMPVYVSCNFSQKTGFPVLNRAAEILQSAVSLVSQAMPYWNMSQGRDHVFVATHDYGACFHAMEDIAMAMGIPQFLRNSVILQTFGQKKPHPCQDVDHIQIPPYVVPDRSWPDPRAYKRTIFAFFRGKMEIHPKNVSGHMYSRGVRTVIWRRFSHDRKFFIKRKRSEKYKEEMLRSIFCLCPLGWAPWSPRIVESVIYGCVPVIIADNISLPYTHMINWSQISVTLPERDVRKLDRILHRVAATNLSVIQSNLWRDEVRRALVFSQPLVKGDATWQILDLLSKRQRNNNENENNSEKARKMVAIQKQQEHEQGRQET